MVNQIDSLKANRELVTRERDGIRGKPNQTTPAPQSQPKEKSTTDQVSLTDTGLRLQKMEQRLAQHSGIDKKRVEAISKLVDKGLYPINAGSIADKLLSFERNFGNN